MYTYIEYNLKEIKSFTNLHLNTNDYILLLINENQKTRDSLCVSKIVFS